MPLITVVVETATGLAMPLAVCPLFCLLRRATEALLESHVEAVYGIFEQRAEEEVKTCNVCDSLEEGTSEGLDVGEVNNGCRRGRCRNYAWARAEPTGAESSSPTGEKLEPTPRLGSCPGVVGTGMFNSSEG